MEPNASDEMRRYYDQWVGERTTLRAVCVGSPTNADSVQMYNNIVQQCVTAGWATFSMFEFLQYAVGDNSHVVYAVNTALVKALRNAHVCVLILSGINPVAYVGAGIAIGCEKPIIAIGDELSIEWCPSVMAFCKTTADFNLFLTAYNDRYSHLLSHTSRLRATAAHFTQWRFKPNE